MFCGLGWLEIKELTPQNGLSTKIVWHFILISMLPQLYNLAHHLISTSLTFLFSPLSKSQYSINEFNQLSDFFRAKRSIFFSFFFEISFFTLISLNFLLFVLCFYNSSLTFNSHNAFIHSIFSLKHKLARIMHSLHYIVPYFSLTNFLILKPSLCIYLTLNINSPTSKFVHITFGTKKKG